MKAGLKGRIVLLGLMVVALSTTGCARLKELERINRQQAATIVSLNNEITRLSDELDMLSQSQSDLARAKAELEEQLQSELASGNLGLRMSDRGLVVTVLDKVLFDSGKADLKSSASGTLGKVADVLKSQAENNRIFVEGHTDNDPIRVSGWRSNWELSTARATEVIHYFIDQTGLDPENFVASGYGEFQPVAENSSVGGKQQNRRVEIIISPNKAMSPEQFGPESAVAAPEAGFIK